jgi:hypothetical protein
VNAPDAKRLVVASVVVTGVLASVKDVSRGQMPRVKVALGLTFAGVALAAVADVAPQLAGSFAALLLVSSVLTVGGDAFAAIGKGLK